MIKFTGINNQGQKVYFMGVSRDNINKLVAGQPIPFNLGELNGPDATVVILFGETERMLFNQLKNEGLIPPEVKYHEPESGEVQKVLIRRGKPVLED